MNKYNLIDLLSGELGIETADGSVNTYRFEGVRIPMIQRDYAHGRKGEEEIRKRFLDAIFSALENDENLELDFVYGAVRTVDEKDYFIPIDGQQRLTTLFLLEWYIGNRELDSGGWKPLTEALSRFSYETRATATEFCENLSGTRLCDGALPSEEITRNIWFFDLYRKDPTISGMLLMLDEIHKRYGTGKRALYPSLKKICFYIIQLDNFHLSVFYCGHRLQFSKHIGNTLFSSSS